MFSQATETLKYCVECSNLPTFSKYILHPVFFPNFRVHHKFCDSNADPHNVQRGFFFSHMGWLLLKKHPDVKEKGATIDMSDLEQDKIVMFQRK